METPFTLDEARIARENAQLVLQASKVTEDLPKLDFLEEIPQPLEPAPPARGSLDNVDDGELYRRFGRVVPTVYRDDPDLDVKILKSLNEGIPLLIPPDEALLAELQEWVIKPDGRGGLDIPAKWDKLLALDCKVRQAGVHLDQPSTKFREFLKRMCINGEAIRAYVSRN